MLLHPLVLWAMWRDAAGPVSKTLSEEANVDCDETLTKAEASERIDELQALTGLGK